MALLRLLGSSSTGMPPCWPNMPRAQHPTTRVPAWQGQARVYVCVCVVRGAVGSTCAASSGSGRSSGSPASLPSRPKPTRRQQLRARRHGLLHSVPHAAPRWRGDKADAKVDCGGHVLPRLSHRGRHRLAQAGSARRWRQGRGWWGGVREATAPAQRTKLHHARLYTHTWPSMHAPAAKAGRAASCSCAARRRRHSVAARATVGAPQRCRMASRSSSESDRRPAGDVHRQL